MSANDELQAHTCEKVMEFYEKPQDYVKKSHNEQTLTELWKKGELEEGEYYIKSNKGDIYIDICANGSFMFTNYRSIEEVLGEVPDYTIWRNYVTGYCDEHEYNLKLQEENERLKELLDSMQDTNKLLAHKLQPFTDPYFRGLTTKDIAELAKKSIRLCKQSCEDNTTIQNLKELLGYCADILEEWDDKDRDIEILLEEVDEALK